MTSNGGDGDVDGDVKSAVIRALCNALGEMWRGHDSEDCRNGVSDGPLQLAMEIEMAVPAKILWIVAMVDVENDDDGCGRECNRGGEVVRVERTGCWNGHRIIMASHFDWPIGVLYFCTIF